jgi:tRNA modification GTPase
MSLALRPLRDTLVELVVQLESSVEFVEEGLPLESRSALSAKLLELHARAQAWVRSFEKGRLLREGFGLAVVGRANVGKSSLFNALLERERSIVTEVPGTTRDTVSELTSIGGLPVHLVDTAGQRETDDQVERLGVERSVRAMADADAVLFVVDGSEPLEGADLDLRRRLVGTPCLVVVNKSDLGSRWSEDEEAGFLEGWAAVRVSAKTGDGIGSLRRRIRDEVFGSSDGERDGLLITNARHAECLRRTSERLEKAEGALIGGVPEEFVLADLHAALREMGRITGEVPVEDLLGEIFSRFCVGK